VCVRLCALSRSHFLSDFHKNWHRRKKFVGDQHRTTSSPILPQKTPILSQMVLKIHANINNPTSPLNVHELPKFSRLIGNRGWGTRCWRQILDRKENYGRFAHAQWKMCNISLISGPIEEIFTSHRKPGSRNTMVTSDFRPEAELWPFCACAVKNTQYNPYLWPNRQNSRVLREIGVEEVDGTWHEILVRKWNYSRFAHAQWKMRNITVIYCRIAKISASCGKLG